MGDSDFHTMNVSGNSKKVGGKKPFVNAVILVLSILISIMLVFNIPAIRKMVFSLKAKSELVSFSENDSIKNIHANLEKTLAQLQKKSLDYTPVDPYFIANMTINEFWMYKNRSLVLHGQCSTGSYIQLEAGNDKKWIFKTPRGERRIRGKETSPVWTKPDWAFIEEGLPVPSGRHPSRYEYGVLGDYALSLGEGYKIHGTIYKRQLGAAVTHGCIRLDDEDLEKVYRTLNVGSKVYFY